MQKAFEGFYCEIDANQNHETIIDDMARIMKIKVKPNAPRRPPRILIVGPPGSGRSTLARLIAHRYGLIYVGMGNLLSKEIAAKTEAGRMATQAMKAGELVSNAVATDLIEARLKASDCRANGWVLEGFPLTDAQIFALKTMRMVPSLIVFLELDDDLVYERHEYKKCDPVTGIVYNLKDPPALDEEVLARLVRKDWDHHENVKKRLKLWQAFLPSLTAAYKDKRLTLNADKPVSALIDAISEEIQGPIS